MTYQIGTGSLTSKDIEMYKADLAVEELDLRIPEESDFMSAVVPQYIPDLDIRFQMPKETVIPPFRIDEGQTVVRQKLGWFDTGTSLYGYRSAIEITDAAKVRGNYGVQWRASLDGVADGFIEAHDTEIISALYAGAANTQSAATEWSDVSGKDILSDVAGALRKVFQHKRSNIKTSEINNLTIYYPSKLVMDLDLPEQFQNGTSGAMGYNIPNDSQSSILRGRNIKFVESSRLNEETFAIGVMPGPKTARHYMYRGPEIPRIEEYRNIEEGTEGYMVTEYFRTHIIPQSSTQLTTNDRIFLISGVAEASE